MLRCPILLHRGSQVLLGYQLLTTPILSTTLFPATTLKLQLITPLKWSTTTPKRQVLHCNLRCPRLHHEGTGILHHNVPQPNTPDLHNHIWGVKVLLHSAFNFIVRGQHTKLSYVNGLSELDCLVDVILRICDVFVPITWGWKELKIGVKDSIKIYCMWSFPESDQLFFISR